MKFIAIEPYEENGIWKQTGETFGAPATYSHPKAVCAENTAPEPESKPKAAEPKATEKPNTEKAEVNNV